MKVFPVSLQTFLGHALLKMLQCKMFFLKRFSSGKFFQTLDAGETQQFFQENSTWPFVGFDAYLSRSGVCLSDVKVFSENSRVHQNFGIACKKGEEIFP